MDKWEIRAYVVLMMALQFVHAWGISHQHGKLMDAIYTAQTAVQTMQKGTDLVNRIRCR